MRKSIAFMAFALLLGTGIVISCGGDDDDEPQPQETPQTPETPETPEPPVVTAAGVYGGWTLGSNPYAAYIPSDGDTLTITLANEEGTLCDLEYKSETWGTALLKGVAVTKNDTAFVLSKPITATIREDHSAWDFTAAVDSIAMPNRNPQSGATTIKNYPIVLTSGVVSLDKNSWQIDFQAFLVARSEHIQNMSFRSGTVQ